ncbi:SPFH domain/band 7 family protein [Lentilactobacillus kosonis]|uniref:SPFH domain/band 7 family protein n=1 Tax=Lentilactobacillus kosonis TaxID=2810561 RepID=A0A401FN55_9LACO|nr:SPFH domain/band 7 family protein [Lentilactobacillus kosonis]
MKEKSVFHVNGYAGLLGVIIILILGSYLAYLGTALTIVLAIIIIVADILFASSLTIISPNQAKVLTFFGQYIGTIKSAGLYMTVPLTNKAPISLKVRNFNSSIIKVNDLKGNPVEIAAVIVYRVVDSAKHHLTLMRMNNLWRFKVNQLFGILLANTLMTALMMTLMN